MILAKKGLWIFAVICFVLVFSVFVIAREKQITLKLATLAPKSSAWMRVFNKGNRELVSRTGGMVRMRAYPGGVMGDDEAVLRKMRIGQIQIAGLMGMSLGKINKEFHVLGAPFLFRNYEEVDHVLPEITGRLEKALEDKGYVLLGWSEIGFVYMMSKKPMSGLEAIRKARVWMPEGNPMSQAVFQKAGVSTVPLAVSDVLLALQTGLVNVIYAPPVGAIGLQWFTKVKYITRVPLCYSMGAVVMTRKAFESIPPDHQKILKEIFRKNLAPINAQTRQDNEEALRLLAREGIRSVELRPQELERFQRIAQETMEEIAGRVLSKAILQKVDNLLAEFRRGKLVSVRR